MLFAATALADGAPPRTSDADGRSQSAPSSDAPPVIRRDGNRLWVGGVLVDPATRTVTVPATMNMTNGILEYALVADYGKSHESLLVTDVRAMDLQSALLLLNARPAGTSSLDRPLVSWPLSSAVRITVAWEAKGRRVVRALDELIGLTDENGNVTQALSSGAWLFNGSMISAEGFAAHFEGSYVSLIRDPTAIVNNPRPDRDDDEVHSPMPGRLPSLKSPVSMIFEVLPPRHDAPEASRPLP